MRAMAIGYPVSRGDIILQGMDRNNCYGLSRKRRQYMILTSAEANKRLKKLNDELRALEVMESKSAVFNAAVGEDE